MDTTKILYERLIMACIISFIIGDIYPHPSLGSGLIQSSFNHIQQTIVSE